MKKTSVVIIEKLKLSRNEEEMLHNNCSLLDLGLNSINAIEIIYELETLLNIEIGFLEVEDMNNLEKIQKIIDRKLT